MKNFIVVYTGDCAVVRVHGREFRKGQPVILPGDTPKPYMRRLRNNRFFAVQFEDIDEPGKKAPRSDPDAAQESGAPGPADNAESSEADPETPQCEFPTGSKGELEDWARENLGLELDKRKSLKSLIEQVQEAAVGVADGDN